MFRKSTKAVLTATVVCALSFGCASNKSKPSQDQYSGYLEDYSGLKKTKDVAGERVLRMVSKKLAEGNYQKVMIDPVQFYPEPKPTEQVSAATLQELKDYIRSALRDEMKVPVVDEPGPGVARMRVALTAVGAETEGMKPYQFIPIGLVLTAGQAAVSGGRPQQAAILLEGETVDSVTGERLAIAVRGGTGERLKKATEGGRKVTLDSLKPLFDKWAKAYAGYMSSVMKAQ